MITKNDIKILNEMYDQVAQPDESQKFGNATIVDADNPNLIGTRILVGKKHPEGPYEDAYEVEFEDGETDWMFPHDFELDATGD